MNFDTPEGLAQLGVIMGLLRAKKGDDTGGLLMNFANTQEQIKSRKQQQEMMQQRMAMEAAERQKRDAAEQQRQAAIAKLAETNPQLAPLLQLNPEEGVRRAFPEQKLQFAPNGQVVDMRSLQPGQSFAKQPDWMNPDYRQFQFDRAKAGRPVVNASASLPPQEKQEQKDYGGLLVSNFKGLQESAAAARRENATLSGLEKIPLETNALTPANVTVSSWIAALGGGDRFKDVASQGQGFTGFAKELVLARQQAQKGPQTEADARRLEQSTAQLGNTTEANKLLVAFNKAVNKRIIEQERFFSDWRAKKGTFDGAERAWFEGKGGTSVWDEPELKKLQKSTPSGGAVLRFDSNGDPL